MRSRENKVTVGFVLAALAIAYGGRWLTDISDSVFIAVILILGIVIPLTINQYLEAEETG